mgnify:CR=1 FL=1
MYAVLYWLMYCAPICVIGIQFHGFPKNIWEGIYDLWNFLYNIHFTNLHNSIDIWTYGSYRQMYSR